MVTVGWLTVGEVRRRLGNLCIVPEHWDQVGIKAWLRALELQAEAGPAASSGGGGGGGGVVNVGLNSHDGDQSASEADADGGAAAAPPGAPASTSGRACIH